MRKIILLSLTALILYKSGYCQITEGNWLVGGNATFSKSQNLSTASAKFKQTSFQINPLVGYFLKEKFAVGLTPSLAYGNTNPGNSNTTINVGPFARYYFLAPENKVNLFAEVSYSYGSITGKGQDSGQKSNTFSFSGGPVLYFNTSVGMEFIISYSTSKVVGFYWEY